MRETTALGAAIAAGLAFGLWRNFAELRDINRAGGSVFEPQLTPAESARKFSDWEKAVNMSKGWLGDDNRKMALDSDQLSDSRANGENMVKSKRKNVSGAQKGSSPAPVVSEFITGTTAKSATAKLRANPANGDLDFLSARTSFISVSGDLDDADEEYLLLELRKVEILQKLKKLRSIKLNYL